MSKQTVVIGCKLPNGFFMQVGEASHVIKGYNSSSVIGGHGITEDVPADLWGAWLKENKDRDLVKNGFVFAHSNKNAVKAEASEKTKAKSGTEPLERPKNDEVQ
jgi:hypothetical protein